jgi:Domain of unknown function (DUF4920)
MKLRSFATAGLLIGFVFACDKGSTSATAPSPKVVNTASPSTTAPTSATATNVAGTKYGAGVTQTAAVSVDEILANPSAYAGKPVRVEGMVTDVCPKRGCWFEIAGSKPGQKLRFKVQDGDMVFPMEAKGKFAVAEGMLAIKELSVEETKKLAEYQSKEYGIAYDPASITAPSTQVRLDGTGAMIRDEK